MTGAAFGSNQASAALCGPLRLYQAGLKSHAFLPGIRIWRTMEEGAVVDNQERVTASSILGGVCHGAQGGISGEAGGYAGSEEEREKVKICRISR